MRRRADIVMLWPVSACLFSVVLWAGCSPADDNATADHSTGTLVLDGQPVEVRHLTGAASGLCVARQQASTDPRRAKATYDRRSRHGVELTARALRPSYAIISSSVAEAAASVEADLATDPPGPGLRENLGELIETLREGLARLAIPTAACT